MAAFAEEVLANYNAKLLVQEANGHYFYRSFEHGEDNVMTQACEALPLYFEMVPEETKEDVIAAFRRTLEEKQCFASGEVGLPYIIQTANEYGMTDLIEEFILREEHPSYYAFIKDGMTTLGEYWEENPRSQCHDMMGHIIEWYYNGIAGIRAKAPGFSNVEIRPYLPHGMNEFHCVYESTSGEISVDVKRRKEDILLSVQVAEGIQCAIDESRLRKEGKVCQNIISQ